MGTHRLKYFLSCLHLFVAINLQAFGDTTAATVPVARKSSTAWSYKAKGIYPPSRNLPATVTLDQVTIGARSDSDSIAGTDLWALKLFGNTEGDGSGLQRYDERTVLLNEASRDQSFGPGKSLTFKGATTKFDISGLGCGDDGPFMCVEVVRAAGASIDFTLEEEWLMCRSIRCNYPEDSVDANRYVSFSDLSAGLAAPTVLRNEPANITLSLQAVVSSSSRRYVEGTGLWRVAIFGSASSDGYGKRYDERSQVLTTAENLDKSLLPAQTLGMTIQTQFLLSGVGCDDYPYFCVMLDRGSNPQPSFKVSRAITTCRKLECLFLDNESPLTARFSEMKLNLVLPAKYTSDNPANIGLQVTLTPRQSPAVPTSTIQGTNLWKLAIYGNRKEDGTHQNRFDERSQVLSQEEQNTKLSPTEAFAFDVNSPFLIGKIGCEEFRYFCAELSKGDNPKPDFVFEPPMRVCLVVPCAFTPTAIARPERLSWTLSNAEEGSYGQSVGISLNVEVRPTEDTPPTDLVEGTGLWKVLVFGSPSADGSSSDRFDEKSVLSRCEAEKYMRDGRSLKFNIDTEFVMTKVGCDAYPYFCVKFDKGDNPEPDFIMFNPLVTCHKQDCFDSPYPQFVVQGMNLAVKPGSPTAVKAGRGGSANYLKFVWTIDYDKRHAGVISGGRLWVLALWGSANADGSGTKVSQTPNTLTSLQSKRALTLGKDFELNSVRNNFDMTSATCDEVRYICVQLSRGPVPEDVYEFKTDPKTYVPRACVEMGCS